MNIKSFERYNNKLKIEKLHCLNRNDKPADMLKAAR